ncbi:MAG: orotidine-5'-phosphate decarboxylase [Candidatus Melainabacteria bacterium]|nr:orotidine-5'-phosphate decarboxylase [Candidatus Melainabacteria bacterium]
MSSPHHPPPSLDDFRSMAAQKLWVALDVPGAEAALALTEQLLPVGVTGFKVGMSLFNQAGLPVIEAITARGGRVFLDLKLHDIPSTVARTVGVLVAAGVSFLNVHAQGGRAMMAAAAERAETVAQQQGLPSPTLIAVTVLTSLSAQALAETQMQPSGAAVNVQEYTLHLAKLAFSSGLQGVVCSPQEVAEIHTACGGSFLCVTPGIRPSPPQEGAGGDDQHRTLSVTEALNQGANQLVVGRPIYQASNPAQAAAEILNEIAFWQQGAATSQGSDALSAQGAVSACIKGHTA